MRNRGLVNRMAVWLEQIGGNQWKLWWSKGSRGNRRTKSKRFDGGKRAANAALREFEAECDALPDEDVKLGDFMREWNESRHAAGTISANTLQSYRWAAKAVDVTLDKNIADITVDDMAEALAALRRGGTPSGRPYSQASLSDFYRHVKTSFDAAIKQGLAVSNPCNGIGAPTVHSQDRRSLSPSGSAALLGSLSCENTHEFAVSMILRTGMRAGECLAVKWSDIRDGRLRISRKATKTESGARSIPLDSDTLAFVHARRRHVEEYQASAAGKVDDGWRLCCSEDGYPLTYNALRLWWERHRSDYGMDGWVLHELRHTYLTNLAQAGVHPSVMQRLAGHSSITTTMRIYTHVHDEDMREAMESLRITRKCASECASPELGKQNRPDVFAV